MAYATADPIDIALDSFFADGLITDVLYQVKSGKEATLFCCEAGRSTGVDLIGAKIYRPRQNRGFKNDAIYREGGMPNKRRARVAMEKKTDFGRELLFGSWIYREWETLQLLHGLGANVPRPIAHSDSALLMEYLGDEDGAAPLLHGVALDPAEAPALFDTVMRNIELMLAHDRVHGDLSAYNILYWHGAVTIIDFPQAFDPRFNRSAQELLARDVTNVCRYFARYGVRSDPDRIARRLWTRFVNADL